MSNTAESVLAIAGGEIGYDRYDDPEQGTKYGRWFAGQTGQAWYGTTGVPFCAMFVSWVMAQAGARCAGIPSAYCPYILRDASSAGAVVRKADARPGDVVLFDWGMDGVCDHVGLVEKNLGGYIQTIEGNVGGKVARRTRAWSVVAAIIRPAYDSGAGPAPKVPAEDGAVYRLYNASSGDHMLTESHGEAQTLAGMGWTYEGVAFKTGDGDPVYRLYNPSSGQHMWTTSDHEAVSLILIGWRLEGIGWRAGGGPEVFRLYDPSSGQHLITASEGERDALVSRWWTYEGVAFRAR